MSWMPFWHGLFSVSAVVGGLAGAFAASLRLPIAWQLLGVSAVFAVAPLCRAVLLGLLRLDAGSARW
jgi:hypothetical protein